jgi:hypothetical protein
VLEQERVPVLVQGLVLEQERVRAQVLEQERVPHGQSQHRLRLVRPAEPQKQTSLHLSQPYRPPYRPPHQNVLSGQVPGQVRARGLEP